MFQSLANLPRRRNHVQNLLLASNPVPPSDQRLMDRTNRKAESHGPEASSGTFQSNPVRCGHPLRQECAGIALHLKTPRHNPSAPNPTPVAVKASSGITSSQHSENPRARERHLPLAFAVASKRAPLAVAGLLKKLLLAAPSASGAAPPAAAALRRPACAVAARRLFSTNGAPFRRDDFDSEEEYSGDEDVVYGRLFTVSMFSSADVVDPIGEPMSTGRLLALDEAAAPRRECWVSKEAMPGLGKEHVKVWADQDYLLIEGEGDKDTEYDEEEEAPAWYSHRIEFPEDAFKLDKTKAEMKDGVLKVTVPKIKLEDRKDVFQVKVE